MKLSRYLTFIIFLTLNLKNDVPEHKKSPIKTLMAKYFRHSN